jgi:GntR family transcriptional repressor for pyruvate dehydrogenase complex
VSTPLPELVTAGSGRVADRIVAALRSYIEDNDLREGAKLPPERVFLEHFHVSRSSLREAIRALSTLGLIDVRHGDGMYVGARLHAEPALFDPSEEHALRNLVETRVGVEVAAVTAAVERASEADLDRLKAMIDGHERALRDDPAFTWSPLEFEIALIEATGNRWLYQVEVMLRDAWLSLSGGLRASVSRHSEWLEEHRAILASVRSRNAPQAQRLVAAHVALERFAEDLRAARPAAPDAQSSV